MIIIINISISLIKAGSLVRNLGEVFSETSYVFDFFLHSTPLLLNLLLHFEEFLYHVLVPYQIVPRHLIK